MEMIWTKMKMTILHHHGKFGSSPDDCNFLFWTNGEEIVGVGQNDRAMLFLALPPSPSPSPPPFSLPLSSEFSFSKWAERREILEFFTSASSFPEEYDDDEEVEQALTLIVPFPLPLPLPSLSPSPFLIPFTLPSSWPCGGNSPLPTASITAPFFLFRRSFLRLLSFFFLLFGLPLEPVPAPAPVPEIVCVFVFITSLTLALLLTPLTLLVFRFTINELIYSCSNFPWHMIRNGRFDSFPMIC
mmetsp:Transcript_14636/g.21846  ORF Transcript_14636/g.21846 Transcript_14636/m.21846 type:complete len:243 (+) Transcript_14636:1357-2085(+)